MSLRKAKNHLKMEKQRLTLAPLIGIHSALGTVLGCNQLEAGDLGGAFLIAECGGRSDLKRVDGRGG